MCLVLHRNRQKSLSGNSDETAWLKLEKGAIGHRPVTTKIFTIGLR